MKTDKIDLDKIIKIIPKAFFSLYNLLDLQTKQIFISNSINVLKIIWFKYKRKLELHESKERAFTLKGLDITNAFVLADFHARRNKVVIAEGQLAGNFGNFPEKEALHYFEHFVQGTVKDIYGREINIDEDGIRILYKNPDTGKHEIDPRNYEEIRGKRLPWIRETLKTSREIYVQTEKYWISYLYALTFRIKLRQKPDSLAKFLVVIRKERGKPLRIVTAYPLFKQTNFWKHVEPCRSFEQKK